MISIGGQADQIGQLQAIDVARHVYVGKQAFEPPPSLEHVDRLPGVCRLHDVQAVIGQIVDRGHPQQRLVFDDKNGDFLAHGIVSWFQLNRTRDWRKWLCVVFHIAYNSVIEPALPGVMAPVQNREGSRWLNNSAP
jgi:hypothetical protein